MNGYATGTADVINNPPSIEGGGLVMTADGRLAASVSVSVSVRAVSGATAAGASGIALAGRSNNPGRGDYKPDYPTKQTANRSVKFKSEGEARNFARQKVGADAVDVGDNKLRSADGKWQYRAKPGDIADHHIHLELLDPKTGEVLENWHLEFPEETSR
jgi:hypothetical protein